MRKKRNILSLFANIGVAEAYLEDIGFHVAVANELLDRRCNLYQAIYPNTKMICGDITNQNVYNQVIKESKDANVEIVMATPPCQGMSTVGQQNKNDERNKLILPVIQSIKDIQPKYAMIENVSNFINTSITYRDKQEMLVDVVKNELSSNYTITINIINTEDYEVPQSRERMIMLLSRKDVTNWELPLKSVKKVTMLDAIGWIPEIDPYVKDISKEEFYKLFPLYEEKKARALEISKWNNPPVHIYRQVLAMKYTPSGQTAFDNPIHKPIKADGSFVKGYRNTYMRQKWNAPAYTITMDNRKISSQGNVHPGRKIGYDSEGLELYSDPRTLTLYEIMKIMSIPDNWPLPDNAEEAFIRRIIGEGIPPLFIKKLFKRLPND